MDPHTEPTPESLGTPAPAGAPPAAVPDEGSTTPPHGDAVAPVAASAGVADAPEAETDTAETPDAASYGEAQPIAHPLPLRHAPRRSASPNHLPDRCGGRWPRSSTRCARTRVFIDSLSGSDANNAAR